MDENYKKLLEKVERLEGLIEGRENSPEMAEKILDIVFFDQDVATTTTTSYTTSSNGTPSHTHTVTAPKTPTKYLKIYFRGQVGYVPFHIFQ